jgi:hypothetical protein
MSISVNGQSCVPPGFRFHPTEEELLNYYLRKKVASQQIDLDVIRDVDLNKLEPWDIQGTVYLPPYTFHLRGPSKASARDHRIGSELVT